MILGGGRSTNDDGQSAWTCRRQAGKAAMEFAEIVTNTVARVLRSSASPTGRLSGRRRLSSAEKSTRAFRRPARARTHRDFACFISHGFVIALLCGLLFGFPFRLHADGNAYQHAADRALAWLSQSQNADELARANSGFRHSRNTSHAQGTIRRFLRSH